MQQTDGEHSATTTSIAVAALLLILATIGAVIALTGCAYKSVQYRVDLDGVQGIPGTPSVLIIGNPAVAAPVDLRTSAAAALQSPGSTAAASLQPVDDASAATPAEAAP